MDLRSVTEAARILAERREADGLAHAQWFQHQVSLFESTKPEAWIFGANRSGKTEGLAGLAASFLRFGNPDPRPAYAGGGNWIFDRAMKVWLVSLKFSLSRSVLQPKIFNNGQGLPGKLPYIPASEIACWNITNQTLQLRNGSIGEFKSCEAGRDAFPGDALDLIGYDEVPDEEVYKECGMRVGGGRRLLIRGAATILPPVGEPGGVAWMFPKKVKPWLDRKGDDPALDIFTAGIGDNPTIAQEEIDRMTDLFPVGSPEYLIRIKGRLLPSIGGTLVYSGYSREYHKNVALAPLDERTGRHIPSVVPYLPLCLAVDFNPTNGCWLVGQHINDVFRVIDEIAMERSDIASMTYAFRERFPAHAAELWIYGDATGRRRNEQTGEANFYLIQEYLQNYPVPVRFMIPEVNPPVKDRTAAVNRALRPGSGTRMIELAPHLKVLPNDLETTKWKANGDIDKRGEKQSNGADALGYWISFVSPVPRFARTPGRITSIKTPGYLGRGRSGQVFPGAARTSFRGFGAGRAH